MADELPIPPDLLAMADVLEEIFSNVDDLDRERAVAMRDGARLVQARLKQLFGGLDVKLMELCEQPFMYRNQVFYRKPNSKDSADHGAIGRRVVELAVVPIDDTGELPDIHTVARRAVRMMGELYVKPSAVPAAKSFDALDMTRKRYVEAKIGDGDHLEVDDLTGGR